MTPQEELENNIRKLRQAANDLPVWLTKFVNCYDVVRAGWNYTQLHALLDEARNRLQQH